MCLLKVPMRQLESLDLILNVNALHLKEVRQGVLKWLMDFHSQ